MSDITEKTWKYLHGPDDVTHLSFPTGGVPRSFSVIQYAATGRDEVDLDDNGIAIIDNDQMAVVLDGHLSNRPLKQIEFMSSVRKMDWGSFSAFAASHPRYRGRQDDFALPRPRPGVLTNQIQRGVMNAPSNEEDIRSPSMVQADASSDCPFSFPEISRSEALSAILSHPCLQGEDGRWRLSWALPDRTTHPMFKPKENMDGWTRHCIANPELYDLATTTVIEPYLCGAATTWPRSDAGRYVFETGGTEHPDVLCLLSIDGVEIDFNTRGEFGKLLDALPDVAVRDIWKLVQVTDNDLDPSAVTSRINRELNTYRAEYNEAREPDHTAQAGLS
jgi:hypothetical protein